MDKVIVKSMTLHYFKGVINRTIEFGENRTIIEGPNGCGKSTVMDGFFWCLWGKNAAGQKVFGIKTVDENGDEIPRVDHEVSIDIEVNGEPQRFTRCMKPKYGKDGVLTGNTVSCCWNDVPMKMGDYDRQVAAVIGEDVFKMITSPTAFMSLGTEAQRSMLLRMAGNISDKDVASKLDGGEAGQFNDLVAGLTGKSLQQTRLEIDAKLRPINESLTTLPARIDEVKRNAPEEPDMEALEEEKETLQSQIAEIEKAARDDAAAINQRNASRTAGMKAVAEMQTRQAQILESAQRSEREAIHKANQAYIQADAEKSAILGEEAADQKKVSTGINQINSSIEFSRAANSETEKRVENLRKEWDDTSKMVFEAAEYLKCPLYGHVCQDIEACTRYDNNQQSAFESFEQSKAKKLELITEQGKKLALGIQQAQANIDAQMQSIEQMKEEYSRRHDNRLRRIAALEAIMQQQPKRPLIATIKGEDIPEWVELGKKIAEAQAGIDAMTYEEQDSSWKDRLIPLRERLDTIKIEMAKSIQVDAARKRIDALEGQLHDLGAEKAMLEARKKMISDFEQARMDEVSERVNGMFKLARFQMFTKQINGEVKPDCVCLCDGVRYQDANTASKTNTGIDIAHTLAENIAGCLAPMFIDNGESVTDIYNPGMQQIILRVKETSSLEVTWQGN